jgi:hypothetical protein
MANLKGGTTIGGSLALHLGNYTSYTLPLTGGTLNGPLNIIPGNTSGYSEGIRIANAGDNWSGIFLGTDGTTGGNNADGRQWVIARNPNAEFVIAPGGQEGSPNSNGLTLIKNGVMKWYNNIVLNASNYNTYSAFTTGISTSVAPSSTVTIGTIGSSWAGGTNYPTLYGSTPERWVMHINPHISYVSNGSNGYTGTMTGATIRMAGDPSAGSSWDVGIGSSGVGVDRFSIGRQAVSFFEIGNGGGARFNQWLDTMGPIYAYGGVSVGNAGARAGNLAGVNSIAIGDSDTGLRQGGDGVLQVFANNTLVMQYTSSQITSNVAFSAPSFIGSTAWASITGRPEWLAAASLVGTHINAQDWVNSGFYENGGGGSNWPSQSWYNSVNVRHSNQNNYHGFQIAMSFYDNLLWFQSYQGSGTFQPWAYAISNQNIGSQTVAYANRLTGDYIGGGAEAPNFFGAGNLKLQMLTSPWGWADTLWMSGYSGGDVKLSNQIVASKNGPNIGFRQQNYDSGTWGTLYEFITTANINGQTVANSQYVDYLSGRTDNADYPVLWGASQGTNPITGNGKTYAFSCPSVTINSASARLTANYLNANVTVTTAAGDGNGFALWASATTTFGIMMSSSGSGVGGRIAGETTSDYNMYFSMSQGTNRGFVFRNAVGTELFGIHSNGVRSINDVIAFSSSDIRLKDDIKPIENPIDKINKISGNTFIWNDNQDTYTGSDVGVIAQEIENIIPEIVTTRANGYKAVKYEKLVPLLIEGIKEQQRTITKLENMMKEILEKK